jgi:hypothetical protein
MIVHKSNNVNTLYRIFSSGTDVTLPLGQDAISRQLAEVKNEIDKNGHKQMQTIEAMCARSAASDN